MRIKEFCLLLDGCPIAINGFIITEYGQTLGIELVKNWLKLRLQNSLAIEVDPLPLPRRAVVLLREDYGFTDAKDAKYLETALNTLARRFVTENNTHFKRPHKSPGRKPMVAFLKRTLGIHVVGIDECCIVTTAVS